MALLQGVGVLQKIPSDMWRAGTGNWTYNLQVNSFNLITHIPAMTRMICTYPQHKTPTAFLQVGHQGQNSQGFKMISHPSGLQHPQSLLLNCTYYCFYFLHIHFQQLEDSSRCKMMQTITGVKIKKVFASHKWVEEKHLYVTIGCAHGNHS